jgi:hypothetical protein
MPSLVKRIKKLVGGSKKGATPRPADPLQDSLSDPLSSADVKRSKHLSTATATGGVTALKFNKGVNTQSRHGFFKASTGKIEDPFVGQTQVGEDVRESRLRYNREKGKAKREGRSLDTVQAPLADVTAEQLHLGARAVTSSRLDQMLGTDSLSEERFTELNGQKGVTSMRAQGAQIRQDTRGPSPAEGSEGPLHQGYLDVDFSNPETQRSLANLQVNDYLSGQVDRHSGNLFMDKGGHVRGIDNDLSFGDRFDTEFQDAGDMSKHVRNMPELIDRATAERILAMDQLEYLQMLEGSSSDLEHLSHSEVAAAFDRFVRLQQHVEGLLLKSQGADVDVKGRLVDDWNADTYTETMGSDQNSYTKQFSQEIAAVKNGEIPRANLRKK